MDLAIADAYPSAAAARASVAVRDHVDVRFGPYGAGPAVAAARVAPTVLWNHGGASARLVRQAFPHVVNVPAPAATYLAAVINAPAPPSSPAPRLYSCTREQGSAARWLAARWVPRPTSA